MSKIILIKPGELWLKGRNRSEFTNCLIDNISTATGVNKKDIESKEGRIYIEKTQNLRHVFGIHSFVEAQKTALDYNSIKDTTVELLGKTLGEETTFKVSARRSEKSFEKTSEEINKDLGADILDEFNEKLSVDVHSPDITVFVEVRKEGVFVYTSKDEEAGPGGLPVGMSGNGLLMLSGGIDSPVAGWFLLKRGMKVDAVYFHSPPYTSERAKEKVIDLARKLAVWKGSEINLYIPYFTNIQVETSKGIPEGYWTLFHRRIMTKIGKRIADKNSYHALITGENLGQVASQTIQNIRAVSADIDIPIFRPLLGSDKEETIERAKNIDTYRISILPYEDCCTVFASDNPKTQVTPRKLLEFEEKFDIDGMIEEAIDKMETISIKPEA